MLRLRAGLAPRSSNVKNASLYVHAAQTSVLSLVTVQGMTTAPNEQFLAANSCGLPCVCDHSRPAAALRAQLRSEGRPDAVPRERSSQQRGIDARRIHECSQQKNGVLLQKIRP